MTDKEAAISMALKKAKILGPIFGFIAPAFFLIIAYLLIDSRTTAQSTVADRMILIYILYAESIISFFAAIFINRKIPLFIMKYFSRSPSGVMEQIPEYRLKSQYEALAQTIPIITFIFIESCTLFGFVLFLLDFDFHIMVQFVAFTVIGYLIVLPRREFFERLYDKIENHNSGVMT